MGPRVTIRARPRAAGVAAAALGLVAVAACGLSSDADRLAEELRADPMIADDLGVPDYRAGDVGTAHERGTLIIVDRTYRGPAAAGDLGGQSCGHGLVGDRGPVPG